VDGQENFQLIFESLNCQLSNGDGGELIMFFGLSLLFAISLLCLPLFATLSGVEGSNLCVIFHEVATDIKGTAA
jgi:hypothetical protein